MSDGVPKSRVTLVYDTKQPEGREKPRELPFRLLVLGDVGGDKSAPLDQRKVRQLNGRNLGEVIKGLRVEVRDIDLGEVPASAATGGSASAGGSSAGGSSAAGAAAGGSGAATSTSSASAGAAAGGAAGAAPGGAAGTSSNGNGSRPKARVRIDSMSSFSPDDVLKLLTGQKAQAKAVDPTLSSAWGISDPKQMWAGDDHLSALWKKREQVVGFQKSYQNSKTLRAALKRFSVPPTDSAPDSKEVKERREAIAKMRTEIASALKAQSKPTT